MREVNEMYLGLNTLRDRFGIGPLIKNQSEGAVMWGDGVRPGETELPEQSLLHVIISHEERH